MKLICSDTIVLVLQHLTFDKNGIKYSHHQGNRISLISFCFR